MRLVKNLKKKKMDKMPSKRITLEDECLEGILAGVNKTAAVIRSTMGARGQYTAIQTSGGGVYFTKDGANSARQIKLSDELEDVGAKMVIEAAINTADQAGDGTTSTTVILHELVKRGIGAVKAGSNKVVVANELEAIAKSLVKAIPEMAQEIDVSDIETLTSIATISANGDSEIGFLVADMVSRIGKDGTISVLDSGTLDTRTEIVTGTKVDSGYFSPYFVNNQGRRICEFKNPMIAITDYDMHKIEHIKSMVITAGEADAPLIIIGSNFEGEALSTLVYNAQQGAKICCIRAPGSGSMQMEFMEDIASVTGGKFLSEGKGNDIRNVTMGDFGHCEKITVSHDKTIITNGSGDEKTRVAHLKEQLENEDSPVLQNSLENRIERLTGGVGVIYVGDAADSSLKEKMDRIEDAVFATQAAVEEGIVAGGGLAYLDLSRQEGLFPIVRDALRAPMMQICKNAGLSGEYNVQMNLDDSGKCTDVTTGERVNAIDAGIIDPAKVIRCAIENAFQNAVTILKTNSAITVEHD